jgi:hypothetical protein
MEMHHASSQLHAPRSPFHEPNSHHHGATVEPELVSVSGSFHVKINFELRLLAHFSAKRKEG